MPRQTVNYNIISGCISLVSINDIPIASKVSGLLELKIMAFDPSLVTFRNLEHFKNVLNTKNLGQLWLAYKYRTSGRFYMLQLISVDSRHFTRPELSLGWSDLHEIKSDKI